MTMGHTFGKAHQQIIGERQAEHESRKANEQTAVELDTIPITVNTDLPAHGRRSLFDVIPGTPSVGEVWESRDRRSRGKLFVVAQVEGAAVALVPIEGGKQRIVALARFNGASNGYAFVRSEA